ncbi:EFR1 family ferrodoxin [Mediterraneibacter massiliensis]|uniref:EFR1 family ferrodoxin n=1 Tax=Mediterraneibacter massiliensis TaxID=1720300 RepID=UPI0022E61529|nr:EFR1 family ferrodoxin [Mediterraneibacter massiliensis]
MKMNELKLVYFSPTGTTRKVIMELAKNIHLKSVSFDFSVHKEKRPALSFMQNDFVLFGVPVYAGRVPRTFLDCLKEIQGNNPPAAVFVTYGCREYEDALLELKTEVENRGFKVIGAAAFPTEHSIVRSIGLGRPSKEDMKVISDFATQLNRRLKAEQPFESYTIDVPGNTPYKKYGTAGLYPKADINLCTECKACAKVCPAGAISLEDPKKTDKDKCISCQKCVRICRQKARSVSTMKLNALTKKLTKVCKNDKAADIFL